MGVHKIQDLSVQEDRPLNAQSFLSLNSFKDDLLPVEIL